MTSKTRKNAQRDRLKEQGYSELRSFYAPIDEQKRAKLMDDLSKLADDHGCVYRPKKVQK